MNSTPLMASIGRMSRATMRPRPCSTFAAYWLQPPGAAPRSTTVVPGLRMRSVRWISSSLNKARERKPASRARFTNTSLSCSCSQRWLDLVRLGMQPNLTEKQKKHLRGLAHARDPVVLIGQGGLSPAVTAELETALGAHELVKVRARVGDRDQRDGIFAELSQQTRSALVQRIGNVAVFYRPRKDKPRIILPAD